MGHPPVNTAMPRDIKPLIKERKAGEPVGKPKRVFK